MVYIVQYIYIQSANACTAVHEQPSYERAAATGGAALVDACSTLYFVRGIDAKPRNGETAQECKRKNAKKFARGSQKQQPCLRPSDGA